MLDSTVDPPYPYFSMSSPCSPFQAARFVWSFMCSWPCLWSVSSSVRHCFGVLTGSIFGLLPHEEQPSAARSTVSSSPAAQTIAPPVVSPPLPRWLEGQHLRLCAPGARSKAGGERPSAYRLPASLVPISSACILTSRMLTSTRWSAMASTVVLSRSRRSAVRPAAPRSQPGATPPVPVENPLPACRHRAVCTGRRAGRFRCRASLWLPASDHYHLALPRGRARSKLPRALFLSTPACICPVGPLLRKRLRSHTHVLWLWLVIDPSTKILPVLHLVSKSPYRGWAILDGSTRPLLNG